MALNSYTVTEFDLATIGWSELLEGCRIVAETWPKPEVNAEKIAQAALAQQAAGEFSSGRHRWYEVRDQTSGRVLAHAACLPREIRIEGSGHTILGLAAVCTRPEYRRQGLGAAVVRACFAHVDQGEYPWCLFQTSQANRRFYESLGASVIGNRIVNSQSDKPQADPFWDELRMVYPASKAFPAGVVDLLGPGY